MWMSLPLKMVFLRTVCSILSLSSCWSWAAVLIGVFLWETVLPVWKMFSLLLCLPGCCFEQPSSCCPQGRASAVPVGTLKKVSLDLLSISDGAVEKEKVYFLHPPSPFLMGTCVAQIGLELIYVAKAGHPLQSSASVSQGSPLTLSHSASLESA